MLPEDWVKLVGQLEKFALCLAEVPASFCRTLLIGGHHDALLKIDTATRAKLGHQVERLLRGVKVLHLFEASEADQPDFFKQAECWVDRDVVRGGVLAFLDLLYMSRAEGSDTLEKAFPRFDEAKSALRGKLTATIGKIVHSSLSEKEAVVLEFQDMQALTDIVNSNQQWISAEFTVQYVQKNNENTKPLQKCIAGSEQGSDVFGTFPEY